MASETVPDIEGSFIELYRRWRRETGMLSSIMMKSMHPAYQRIIGMGPRAVPLILRQLMQKPDHWFWALTAITGDDPVRPEDAGDIDKMTAAWISYGKQKGYL
ncbi:MAG: hypothetical protein Q7T82_06460 [Armatimonadota bacterium]|nr:hypothetical protein [Armatimonadota bacterium]